MQNPCKKCKKSSNCPSRCFPKKDYDKAISKRKRTKLQNKGDL